MTPDDKILPDAESVAHLLPWFATGRLEPDERRRVEEELAQDDILAERLADIRDERDETVRLNEALGVPSRQAADELFRRIDAEPRAIGSRLAGALSALRATLLRPSPRAVAWAGGLAVLVIVAQAGLIGGLLPRGSGASYETASGPRDGRNLAGSIALVGFVPTATAAEVTAALDELGMTIVDGPHGGLYRVRLSPEKLPRDAVDALLGKLRARPTVVLFAAPGS